MCTKKYIQKTTFTFPTPPKKKTFKEIIEGKVLINRKFAEKKKKMEAEKF